jgi:hypothetical protein
VIDRIFAGTADSYHFDPGKCLYFRNDIWHVVMV